MLSNFTQFAPQGMAPQIPGFQGIGSPQLNSVLSGQPGIWPGYELGQQGLGQQLPPWAQPSNPVGLNPVTQLPIVQVFGQLAQQLAIQSAITQQVAQQISVAVQHLVHQLGVPGQHGQYYGQNPYAPSVQGGYSGFNPQLQAWGANRTSTIQ
jgi:hypothetical protein